MRLISIYSFAFVITGCSGGTAAPPAGGDDDDVVPDAALPTDFVHDPGLEGAPLSLSDPACARSGDRIDCADVVYSTVGDTPLHLDIHAPASALTEQVPAILYLHPGGWSIGSYHQTAQLALADYVARGYAVLSVEYRLTLNPDRTVSGIVFPDNLRDVKTAIRWMRIKGADFIDPDRVMLYGVSSGGHLAALAAVTPTVGEFDGRGDPSVPVSVKAVVAISPPTDFHLFVPMNPPLDPSCASQPPGQDPQQGVSLLIGGDLNDPQYGPLLDKLSPLTYLNASSPPMQVFAGTCDQTVPYHGAEEVAALGLPQVNVFIAQGAFHGTTLESPQAKSTLDAFVSAQLR